MKKFLGALLLAGAMLFAPTPTTQAGVASYCYKKTKSFLKEAATQLCSPSTLFNLAIAAAIAYRFGGVDSDMTKLMVWRAMPSQVKTAAFTANMLGYNITPQWLVPSNPMYWFLM